DYSISLQLDMFGPGNRVVPVLGRARFVRRLGQIYLRLVKVRMGEVGERWHELQTSVALLESIIENAKE
ncbi:hypothetical protein, partial [Stenotrophomonas maltophilia]|uniref:hypothetical protein n=1 Tax=Stenotrophomonas maltophilia TaxID=40324 RepID=UPI0019532C27